MIVRRVIRGAIGRIRKDLSTDPAVRYILLIAITTCGFGIWFRIPNFAGPDKYSRLIQPIKIAGRVATDPGFDTLAEAFGAEGFRIDEYDEVAETVEAALAYDGPSVIDCHIDPAENVYPMVPSGGANGKFALTEEQL